MSFRRARSFTPEPCAVSAYFRCTSESSVTSRSSVIPRMPFIGVRISWLMFARNCDFVRLAVSASSFDFLRSASAFFLSVMSIATQT